MWDEKWKRQMNTRRCPPERTSDESVVREELDLGLMGCHEGLAELLRRLPNLNVRHADADTVTSILEPALRKERVSQEGVLAITLREESARRQTVINDVDTEGREWHEPSAAGVGGLMEHGYRWFEAVGIDIALENDT